MTRSFSPGGIPTEDVAAYYRRRAEGGTGLIITEGTTIDHGSASGDPHIPNFHTPEALDGWSRVVDEVHEGGGLIMPQIWHMGAMRPSGTGPSPETETVSPSGLKYPGKETGIALSKQEVNDIVDAYVSAAVSAKELGFDGVQFHGAHGYLIDLFFWSGTNLRDDEFGGELAERTRFAEDIISKTRAEVGDDFPLILRFSQWKQQDFEHKMATDPDQLAAFLAPLTAAGVDSFDPDRCESGARRAAIASAAIDRFGSCPRTLPLPVLFCCFFSRSFFCWCFNRCCWGFSCGFCFSCFFFCALNGFLVWSTLLRVVALCFWNNASSF